MAAVIAAGSVACTGGGSDGGSDGGSESVRTVVFMASPAAAGPTAVDRVLAAGLALEEAVAAGAVAVREVDAGTDPARAARLAAEAVADGSVVAVVGPPGRDTGQAARDVVAPSRVAFVDLSDASSGGEVGAAMAAYVHRGLGARSAALLSASGSPLGAELARAGLTVVADVVVAAAVDLGPGSAPTDHAAAVEQVRALEPPPDVLVTSGASASSAGHLRRQLTDGGLRSRLVGGPELLDPAFLAAAGSVAARGTQALCSCWIETAGESGDAPDDFAQRFAERFGRAPGPGAAEVYASVVAAAAGRGTEPAPEPALEPAGGSHDRWWVYELGEEGRITRLGTVVELTR